MNKLRVYSFKAFEQEVSIPLDNRKNLLLYGENGAGKSSLYEAMRVIFFKDRIEGGLTAPTPEDLNQMKQELWSGYNNRISNANFEIEINNIDHAAFEKANYQVFMISIEEMAIGNKINLQSLLESFCLSITDIPSFCATHFFDIQQSVNSSLIGFHESVAIEIDQQEDYDVKIIDTKKNLERKSAIKSYFNEAKLNLILLLILLNAIIKAKDPEKKKIIVLDDFITSLDVSNRTFLVRYLMDNLNDFQQLIFTHNISFFNLIMHIVNDIDQVRGNWQFVNLFEINNSHKLYIKPTEKVADIKAAFTNLPDQDNQADIETIGNRIRKKFEVLLYEYSKLLMVGAVEESKNILTKITKGEGVYFSQGLTASDLINQIQAVLNENNPNNLSDRIQNKIDAFKYEPYNNFQKVLKELKLYQKVTMHPMSHGIAGMNNFTVKEIEKSIELLAIMESYIKALVDGNVAAV